MRKISSKRINLIILCLLCILLVNSCTTESLSGSKKTADANVVASEESNKTQSEQQVVPTENGAAETVPADTSKKEITITIVDRDGSERDETINTNSPNLLEALKVSGQGEDSSETPGYIIKVGDREADASQYEWWQISKDGVPLSTSADSTPIANGEHYTFTLKGPE